MVKRKSNINIRRLSLRNLPGREIPPSTESISTNSSNTTEASSSMVQFNQQQSFEYSASNSRLTLSLSSTSIITNLINKSREMIFEKVNQLK